jgi:leucyl/phenylalanyl-tRNA--protein transferase
MPVYLLDRTDTFPPASEAEASGLLAVGGDLRLSRLLRAYSEGIFPWYSQGEPILWFSPDPRAVIDPGRVRLGRGMRRTLTGAAELDLTMDAAFSRVIRACARVARTGQRGTWITTEMIEAYEGLHQSGYAHSVEAWAGERLVGGVYGVSIGAYFAGESMFHLVSGASLRALVALLRQLEAWGIELFDCQMHTPHVGRLGAELLPRTAFLRRLTGALTKPTRRGQWHFDEDLSL